MVNALANLQCMQLTWIGARWPSRNYLKDDGYQQNQAEEALP